MLKKLDNGNTEMAKTSHSCGLFCLGPLTFHREAVGNKVCLSQGGRLAVRTGHTFRNGLVFSNRPVKVCEKICLRVEKHLFTWHGALRVGFTNVPPSARSLPLPSMAIPDLSDSPGHWAAPVHEFYCQGGSELQFWVSHGGSIYVKSNDGMKHKLLKGVNLGQPLWAMIDIYGQTCSIFLHGSEKRKLFVTRRSCPASEPLTSPDVDNDYLSIFDRPSLFRNIDFSISSPDMEVPADEACVACMTLKANNTLPCGHRCLCNHCKPMVFLHVGTCPLCRRDM
ncbi:E3 ubiquitin-protein ligase NEURL3 [Toxotes jaculatrix]|uniref:E3 ubiquitin-protein ligase NEURL3 n=1 Tax=Toxotes jaculatrix TaxID=941984 RepID=UPI001B3B16D1|nr:E3 ubiquitin-protein ligase NEURL3 [Toxotes jaculatrix]